LTYLNDQFAQSGGEPIEVDGRLVHGLFRTTLPERARIELAFVSVDSPLPQGLALRANKGLLKVGLTESPGIDVWEDRIPGGTITILSSSPQDSAFEIWNLWRHQGATWAFSRNAGITIDPIAGGVRLHCSDGFGVVNFGNLVVDVRISREAE